jgi:hypothetical protein
MVSSTFRCRIILLLFLILKIDSISKTRRLPNILKDSHISFKNFWGLIKWPKNSTPHSWFHFIFNLRRWWSPKKEKKTGGMYGWWNYLCKPHIVHGY